MCLTLHRLGELYGVDYGHPSTGGDGVGPAYVNWDKDSVTSCFCDPGFNGPDCSRSLFQSQAVAEIITIIPIKRSYVRKGR